MIKFANLLPAADRDEFIKMCTAVGTGFIIAGTVGYLVKLSTASSPPPRALRSPWTGPLANSIAVHVPLNNVLVAGA